jgi:mercuric reductase
LGLDALGIEPVRIGLLRVDETLRTRVPTIFAAGDVLGEEMFVYTAAYEGRLAARNALQNFQLKRDYTGLPWVVFTDPQVAGVGLDERQAAQAGLDFEVSKLPLGQVPRSLAARDTRGFIKLIRERESDRVIGARILAPEGSELLMEVALAVRYGITTRELGETFHPYLTLSEGIKLAALTFHRDVTKLSCCAV